ncbi:MAG: hypothetical protein TR69_WS6001001551 [candidate division WS6 bacterium OLB20]|uniref:Uncharacterized protein n=1 Tax=candidate division WS6 bacterium OLB20 TaxID=1617426 RepID=A0A136LVQ2_9BACT|nr:MAG: hypothetical protein TR69_WS6001001551 [candidate division WS6 bacterium OLB20]
MQLLPETADNKYNGHPAAWYVLALITLVSLFRSLVHMFASDGGAQSIATVPLDTYSDAAAAAVIHIFSLWGLSQLLTALVSAIVLVRYRSLIPLMFILLLIEYSSRIILTWLKPVELAGTAPGGVGNYLLVPVAGFMLYLSLQKRQSSKRPQRRMR